MTARIWALAFTGAFAWFADLVVRYYLVEAGWAKSRELEVLASGVTAFACTLLALGAGLYWMKLPPGEARREPLHFGIEFGVGLNALFVLLIGASLLAHALLRGGR